MKGRGGVFAKFMAKGKNVMKKAEQIYTKTTTKIKEDNTEGSLLKSFVTMIENLDDKKEFEQFCSNLLLEAYPDAPQFELSPPPKNKPYHEMDRNSTILPSPTSPSSAEKPNVTNEESKEAAPGQTVNWVMVVGFHHKIGSQIEYMYPSIESDTAQELSPRILELIPFLALPDASHIVTSDYSFFILRDEEQRFLFYGVTCFRQISSDNLSKEASISRNYVQKSVCLLSKTPLFGVLFAKLHPTTQAYFEQNNFKDTRILEDMFHNANQFGHDNVELQEFYSALSLRKLVVLLKTHLLALVKTVLLEGKIIVYSQRASYVCTFALSLAALFPGLLTSQGE